MKTSFTRRFAFSNPRLLIGVACFVGVTLGLSIAPVPEAAENRRRKNSRQRKKGEKAIPRKTSRP